MLTGSRVTGVAWARARSIRPPPRASTPGSREAVKGSLTTRAAVLTRADLTSAGDQSGWSWRSTAAAPATWGVAMLVPWNMAYSPWNTEE